MNNSASTYRKWWFHGLRLAVAALLLGGGKVSAQNMPDSRFRVYQLEGELFMDGTLDAVLITADKPSRREIRKGRKRLEKLTRLRWNVHKVYPYALKISEILQEVQDTLNSLPDDDARKAYIKEKEVSLFGAYEQDLRKMSRSQGKVLVQLVYRETGQATYYLIKDFKSGASALFWQSIGLIFGINLKSEYDLNDEESTQIEAFVRDLERGGYNIAYKKYNFTLP